MGRSRQSFCSVVFPVQPPALSGISRAYPRINSVKKPFQSDRGLMKTVHSTCLKYSQVPHVWHAKWCEGRVEMLVYRYSQPWKCVCFNGFADRQVIPPPCRMSPAAPQTPGSWFLCHIHWAVGRVSSMAYLVCGSRYFGSIMPLSLTWGGL